jgi:hypothetical protein
MGLQNFTPSIWANGYLEQFYKALVMAPLCNRNYQGEISGMGSSVRINEFGDVTINDYTKAATLSYQAPNSAQKILYIDQAKYFAVTVDKIDMVQNNPKLIGPLMQKAAYNMADTVDQFITGMYTSAGTAITAASVSAGNVLNNVSDFALALDENNVPRVGRWLVIPPWYHQKLWQAATGAVLPTAVPKVMDDGMLRNGFVGSIGGFDIFVSNNLYAASAGTDAAVLAGTNEAISFASQLAEMEPMFQRETTFDNAIRGLYIYGAKVVKPEALVYCTCTKTA